MWFGIISLFPDMFSAVTEHGVTGRAVTRGLVEVDYWNPRDFTEDKHQTVDDRPYGGGPGMLMKVQPLRDAIAAAKAAAKAKGKPDQAVKVAYLSPQGKPLTQAAVKDLANREQMILVAGRYEGIDERVIEQDIDEEWSIGDYVLSGGELPAMVMMDSIVRWLPGVLGHEDSAQQDSFMTGLLDCPHYTRPEMLDGAQVPDVLLSGHHGEIERWRLQQALGRTWLRRPDLLEQLELTREQQVLLDAFIAEQADQVSD